MLITKYFAFVLYSVMVLNRIAYTLGQMITFQLMKRERCSLIASPVSQFDLRQSYTSPLLSVSENQLDTAYSKLLAANNQEVSCSYNLFFACLTSCLLKFNRNIN